MRRVSSLFLGALVFALLAPQTHAAKYFLGDNDNLIKGCTGTVEIKVDTEGGNAMAGDSTLNLNAGEIKVTQASIGSALPMQVFNQVTDTQIKLSGARLPSSGNFSGVGTFGYLTFTPNTSASTGTFSFSSDLNFDNTLINDNIENILTKAESKTYTFKDRYDKQVDGIGFCTPDATAPIIQFVNPVPYASNVSANSHIVFTLTDDRAGIDLPSLSFTVDNVTFDINSSQVVLTTDLKLHRIDFTPSASFATGASVAVKVHVCDKSSNRNCSDATNTFQIFTTASLPAICGDGIANPANGEQCDDGNKISGDGCSSLCLIETRVISAPREGATCSDGLMNQGELGVDCGGPCSNACPTCVDHLLNQGEEGVDCGGPCPACEKEKVVCQQAPTVITSTEETKPAAPAANTTICHYPPEDPTHFYTMVIPETLWADHQKHGDTEGSCDVDEMCNILRPVAVEVEKKATEEAQAVVNEQQSQTEQKAVISAPTTVDKSITDIEACKQVPDYIVAKVDFISDSADTDGDGLSNRTECYAKTSPIKTDTDGDSCSDGDELNRFNTNPLDSTDCKLVATPEIGFQQVLITDPKPSWTLGNLSPRISGLVPLKSTAVTVNAFHADQKTIQSLAEAVRKIQSATTLPAATQAISSLQSAVRDAKDFIDLNGLDFNYSDLNTLVNKINTQLSELDKEYGSATSFVPKAYFDTLKKLGFGDLGLELGGLIRDSILIGSTKTFSESYLADIPVSSFELTPTVTLEDQKLYDVVATATLPDTTVSSSPIRFGVNTGFTVSKPIPKTLGGKALGSSQITFGGVLIDLAMAQDGALPQIEIDQSRPVVTGDTEFGSQVFAIWNSVVLSSSVISDSEQGAFAIEAPADLEPGTAHRVTLYAVKTDQNKTLRSESVDIHFKIKSTQVSLTPIFVAVGFSLLAVTTAAILIRRIRTSRSLVKLVRSNRR